MSYRIDSDAALSHGPGSRERSFAYLLLRLFVGLDFFGHGYVRTFTGDFLPGFADSLQKAMATAPLDPSLIHLLGLIIPIVELSVGTLLLLGIFTRWTLTAAFGLLFMLMFGVTMKQDWTAASEQLLYGLVLSLLLFGRQQYDLSWKEVFRRNAR